MSVCKYICMYLHTPCFCLVIVILSLNSLDINYSSCIVLLDFFYENTFLVSSLFYLVFLSLSSVFI